MHGLYFGKLKEKQNILKYNQEYEIYTKKEINGVDLTTVMNKAINNNEQNKIQKDENGKYIDDNEFYTEITIKLSKDDKNYFLMEAFQKIGIEEFTKLYGSQKFKCVKIDYHENGRISKILFEIQEAK